MSNSSASPANPPRFSILPVAWSDGWRRLHWPTLVSGLVLGIACMHMLVAWPMTLRMEAMNRNLAIVNTSLVELAGSRDDARRTTDLLSALKSQQSEMEHARGAVNEWHRLREQLELESRQTGAALTQLRGLGAVQKEVAARAPQAAETLRAVDTLQQEVIAISHAAKQQRDDLTAVAAVLKELNAIKRDLAGQKNELEVARAALSDMKQLQSEAQLLHTDMAAMREPMMAARAGLNEATAAAADLKSLQQSIVIAAENIPAAQASAAGLIALEEKLAQTKETDIAVSGRNLQAMSQIQETLTGRTRQITESVQNLELFVEFQSQFADQMKNLDGLQQQLADVTKLERNITKVVRLLQPIAEYSSVHRLGEDELREVARNILQKRQTRVSQRDRQPIELPAPDAENVHQKLAPQPSDPE